MAYTKLQRRKKRKANGREIRSSYLTLDKKEDKLQDSAKEAEGQTFHGSQDLGMNHDVWDRMQGLGSELWEGVDGSSSP